VKFNKVYKVASEDGALIHASSISQSDSQGASRACTPSDSKNEGHKNQQPEHISREEVINESGITNK